MSAPTAHRWRLVAPWYRWERRDGAEPGRKDGAARPALHKYTSTAYVADFLADPQRSVTFGDVDQYQEIETIPHEPLPTDPRKRRRFLSATRLRPSGVRKLFPIAHQRHYVVAVGLHCDEPGFPRVDPADVAEAGFVVRRQRAAIPAGQEKKAAELLAAVTAAQAGERRAELAAARDRARRLHPFGAARDAVRSPSAAAAAARRDLEAARRELRVWASAVGVDRRTEAWVDAGDGDFGQWVPIDDEPAELIERRYPLRLLTAPAADPDHAAREGTIYWGTVPASSAEVSRDGSARFTELGTYEIRAFARTRGCGGCPGPLVWSAASEPYRLASFHDPDGCSQRPVEIRLPDFAQLEASGATPSVRMSSPPGSSFEFTEDGKVPTSGGVREKGEVCFFALPLITIVAMLVLKIFLPLVTLIFGLFWMLKLKFCIPPSAELEAGVQAQLTVIEGGIQASIEADVDVDVDVRVNQPALETALRTGLDNSRPGALGTKLTADYTNDPLCELLARQGYGVAEGEPFPVFGTAPEHTTPVRRDEVVHP
ncbi:hypothetical protein Ade02nite_15060 [Paractinoplanes deccanensis]|uniref:Uncharacterized protein n=1 Tax=Paractinoplanes deccanensis TaxID=113561 RepID=A0ABQ3XYR0_9ACTN|nr:hypothetical protein [Actinoplanes deccanensis]GID72865.1 hypothetical protein Ade02nite_15060 [Actinoplanes deccanensis]